jgi:hypothetical protein
VTGGVWPKAKRVGTALAAPNAAALQRNCRRLVLDNSLMVALL